MNNYRQYRTSVRFDQPLRETYGAYTVEEIPHAGNNGHSLYRVSGPGMADMDFYLLDSAHRAAGRLEDEDRLRAAAQDVPCMACGHYGCTGSCAY